MRRDSEDDYRQYVVANLDRLRRAAYLLCTNWHTADDLVAVTLAKLYRHWSRAQTVNNLDAYVRTILVRSWLDEQRRPWRREQLTDEVLEVPARESFEVLDRMAVLDLVRGLTPRRRAALVLHYYFDLSLDETAAALGCSPNGVRSLIARGIESIRREGRYEPQSESLG